jgi:hypothetical protein
MGRIDGKRYFDGSATSASATGRNDLTAHGLDKAFAYGKAQTTARHAAIAMLGSKE